jgi:hypothetical protein
MRRSSNLQTLLITNKVSKMSEPLPKDPNQLAYKIVQLSTEEPELPKGRSEISKYLSEIGKKGGLKGGPARAKKLTSKKRKEIARKAAMARWKK